MSLIWMMLSYRVYFTNNISTRRFMTFIVDIPVEVDVDQVVVIDLFVC